MDKDEIVQNASKSDMNPLVESIQTLIKSFDRLERRVGRLERKILPEIDFVTKRLEDVKMVEACRKCTFTCTLCNKTQSDHYKRGCENCFRVVCVNCSAKRYGDNMLRCKFCIENLYGSDNSGDNSSDDNESDNDF